MDVLKDRGRNETVANQEEDVVVEQIDWDKVGSDIDNLQGSSNVNDTDSGLVAIQAPMSTVSIVDGENEQVDRPERTTRSGCHIGGENVVPRLKRKANKQLGSKNSKKVTKDKTKVKSDDSESLTQSDYDSPADIIPVVTQQINKEENIDSTKPQHEPQLPKVKRKKPTQDQVDSENNEMSEEIVASVIKDMIIATEENVGVGANITPDNNVAPNVEGEMESEPTPTRDEVDFNTTLVNNLDPSEQAMLDHEVLSRGEVSAKETKASEEKLKIQDLTHESMFELDGQPSCSTYRGTYVPEVPAQVEVDDCEISSPPPNNEVKIWSVDGCSLEIVKRRSWKQNESIVKEKLDEIKKDFETAKIKFEELFPDA